jgi:uncharacterized protein YprB with RNaseH-like and TPR domain
MTTPLIVIDGVPHRRIQVEKIDQLALRERIAEHPVLVTFNGKSFDWPLLETSYR